MKRSAWVIIPVLVAGVLSVNALTKTSVPTTISQARLDEGTPTSVSHEPVQIVTPGASSFEATYIDGSATLDEMAQNAALIVIATVTDQKQVSTVSVASFLQVQKAIKGQVPPTPVVYQLGTMGSAGDELLQPGKTYFLVLGKQTDGSPNTFFIKGGEEGMFLKENGKLLGQARFVGSLPQEANADPYQVLEAAVKRALK